MRAARPPAAVWLLVAVQLALALAWSVWTPVWRGADEPQHVDLALRLARGDGYPAAFDGRMHVHIAETTRLGNLSPVGAPVPDRTLRFTAAAAPARDERPPLRDLGPDAATGYVNQMPQHPPLAYGLYAVVLRLVGEDVRWDLRVWALRVLNAVLVGPLPLLAWLTARRLGAGGAPALAAAAFPLAIPQLAHTAGTVNNDNVLTLLGGMATVLLAGILAGDRRWRTAVAVGLVTGLALLTKAFALVLLPTVAAAYAIAAWRDRTGAAVAAGPAAHAPGAWVGRGAAALAGAVVTGGWWYARNLVRYGTLQPDAFPLDAAPAGFVPDLGVWAGYFSSRMVLRFWGQLGWLEAPLPWVLVWPLAAVLVACVAAGLAWRPVDRVVLLLPLLLGLGIVAAGTWSLYARTGQTGGVQARYLFFAVTGLAVVTGAGWVRLAGRAARWAPAGLLATALVLQAVAGWTAMHRWWGAVPGAPAGDVVRAVLAWAAAPPAAVAVVAVGLATAVLLAVFVVVQQSRAGDGGDPA
jgi:small subunit ribosomal protein S36